MTFYKSVKSVWRWAALSVLLLGMFAQVAVAKTSIDSITAKELVDKITNDGKGKVVVVNIFASWCAPCREEIPGLIAIRKNFSEKELLLIGISVDKPSGQKDKKVPKALQAFAAEMNFNYPVYVSAPGFESTVGVSAIPQLLVYDREGTLVVNHKGFVSQDLLQDFIQKLQLK